MLDQIFPFPLFHLSSELEPRRQLTDDVELYVDLAATREDHEEVPSVAYLVYHSLIDLRKTGNIKDITMQAGRQRGALPLIRKFNEHSERLLNAAL